MTHIDKVKALIPQLKRQTKANREIIEGQMYESLTCIFKAIVFAYYKNMIQNDEDATAIAHIAAIDLIERLKNEEEFVQLNSFYLRQYLKIYLPGKYSRTRVDVVCHNHSEYGELSDSTEYSMEEYKQIEKNNTLQKILAHIYDHVKQSCPIPGIAGNVANIVIASRLMGLNVAHVKTLSHKTMLNALYLKIYTSLEEA